jgi:competence protein ComFC
MQRLTGIVFPDLCPVCVRRPPDAVGGLTCEECEKQLLPLSKPRCQQCGGRLDTVLERCQECIGLRQPWSLAVSTFPFGGLPRQLIHRFKYQGNVALTPVLVHALVDAWREHGTEIDLLTAVPLHWRKSIRRGYNQSELLAIGLAQELGLPFRRLLRRCRSTAAQAGLDFNERQRNLRNAFSPLPRAECKDTKVLLIDDVFTTGATLGRCTRLIRKAGAAEVSVLTLARG